MESSPRIITVDSPSTEIIMQDLVETIRANEELPGFMDNPKLVSAAGKEALGGGVLVGITVILQNAKLAFEARPGPTFVQCNVQGGNLVALDENGATIDPIQTTAYVQVVRTSSSSATLQELSSIQYSSFDGGISIDTINGVAGTEFPTGTIERPSNNITDAHTIAEDRGFRTFYLLTNFTISGQSLADGYIFKGVSPVLTNLYIESGADVTNCEFRDVTISGILDGNNTVRNSIITNLNYVNGFLVDSALGGTITLGGQTQASFFDCWSNIPGTTTPIIDMGISGNELILRNYNGGLELINKAGSEGVSIDLNSGKIILGSTITNGSIVLRGTGQVIDNSIGSTVVNDVALISGEKFETVKYQIESQRYEHLGVGNIFYWDPYGGDDMNTGKTPLTGKKTWAGVEALTVAGRSDVIYVLANDPSGNTTVTDIITMTKSDVHLRGPGRNLKFKPADGDNNTDTITISANGCSLSGFQVESSTASGTGNCIVISASFALLRTLWINDANVSGIVLNAGSYSKIIDCVVEKAASHAIQWNDNARDLLIQNTSIYLNTGDGINIVDSGASTPPRYSSIENCLIHGNTGQGIELSTNSKGIVIDAKTVIKNNTGGNINNLSTLNVINLIENAVWDEPISGHTTVGTTGEALDNVSAGASPSTIAAAVWDEPTSTHTTTGTFGEKIGKKLLTVAKFLGLK